MNNAIYEKNCAALMRKYGHVLPQPLPEFADVQASAEVVQGQLGFPNLRLEKRESALTLYAEPNPYPEIQSIVSSELADPDVSHIITMGLGLGYVLAEILHCKNDKARVFVLEPRLDILCECFKHLDLSQLIENDQVEFIFETDGTQASLALAEKIQLSDASFKGWRFVTMPHALQLYADYSSEFVLKFGSRISSQKVNLNTVHQHGEIFLRNSLKSMVLMDGHSHLRSYENLYAGQACLVVAAGPSLNKQLPLLHALQDQLVLIAVGQAIRPLHAAGIHPHFVTAIDPHPDTASYFESNSYTREVLVCNTVTDPGTLIHFSGPKIFANFTPEFEAITESFVGRLGCINAGGSVANFSYSLAKYMGFKHIGFVGQDLAYTEGQSHAQGYLAKESRTEDQMAQDSRFRKVPGYYGGMVYTNAQMDMYRDWFEQQFRLDIHLHIYNCTEGGARIEGAVPLALSEFARLTEGMNTGHFAVPAFAQRINKAKLLKLFNQDFRLILEIDKLAQQGMEACAKTERNETNVNQLKKAKTAIVKTRQLLNDLQHEQFNPYLMILWQTALMNISKSEFSEHASPAEVVRPFIPFFKDLRRVCEASQRMISEVTQFMKKGDPRVAF